MTHYEAVLSVKTLSQDMVDKLTACCDSVERICFDIQILEPDHANLFPDLAANKKKVMFESINICFEIK